MRIFKTETITKRFKCACGATHEFSKLDPSIVDILRSMLPEKQRKIVERPILRVPREREPEWGEGMNYKAVTRLAQLKMGHTPFPSRPPPSSTKAAAPESLGNTDLERVSNLLRQKGMREEVLRIWLSSPHKAFGMQVPDSLIAEGRGEEVLRLLDDIHHLRS